MTPTIDELNGTPCKTYLVIAGGEAALVDPLRDRLDTYRAELARRGVALRWVIDTHTHADHLMLTRDAKAALGAPFVMHTASPSPLVDRHVSDGDALALGGASLAVIATPGHTPDSMCLVTGGALLSGDTVLIGGSGRTDFPGGDAGAQYDAVTTRLFTLPEGTIVYPGHDYKGRATTTIGDERRHSARYAGRTRDEYVALMASLDLPMPDKVQLALQVNQSGFEPEEVGFPRVEEAAALAEITPAELAARLGGDAPPVLLDVREPEEFVGELGHVEGSLLVPLDALARRMPKLLGYADREIVVVCRAGARSATAGAILERAGFRDIKNLAGGVLAWRASGGPVCR
ncbi:MAG: MBL fold metallo-hydrolase [Polyangiaceae bacterium]|nr:MBL fold metallo-hydrolase [Polyangiaceae bacterium]